MLNIISEPISAKEHVFSLDSIMPASTFYGIADGNNRKELYLRTVSGAILLKDPRIEIKQPTIFRDVLFVDVECTVIARAFNG